MLPTAGARGPAGPLAGTWDVAAGSVAGFRVQETALGISNETVGRTHAVTGTIAVSGPNVTAAAFRIGLTAIKSAGRHSHSSPRASAPGSIRWRRSPSPSR